MGRAAAMVRRRAGVSAVACLAASLAGGAPGLAAQVPDSTFSPPMGPPTFAAGTGPRVAVDQAHLNFHTAGGGFLPFARLLERDGYRVGTHDEPFTARALRDLDVLVIANALHPQSEHDWGPLPNPSAFTRAEIDALEAWVAAGGSLLLIADHMPIAGHAEALAARFGIRFQNGFALDSLRSGTTTFRRSDGSLAASEVTAGGDAATRVDSVTTFTGQAFRLDPDVRGEPVLVFREGHRLYLPRVAWQLGDSTPQIPAAHLLQGALVRHGRGRVAAFGEAAMFTAQLGGPERQPVGMNHPAGAQNSRLVLRVMAWLAGAER